MHGMLPTMVEMWKQRPELYDDDDCRQCSLAPETASHIWECRETMSAQRTGWTDLISKLNDYGRQVWTKATKAWKEEQEEARRKKRTFKTPRSTFKVQKTGRIRESLGWIGGVWERTHYGNDDMDYGEDSNSD